MEFELRIQKRAESRKYRDIEIDTGLAGWINRRNRTGAEDLSIGARRISRAAPVRPIRAPRVT